MKIRKIIRALNTEFSHILKRYNTLIAFFAIATCLFTWGLDLSTLVEHCPYCRVQRTAIGVLGIIALLPKHKNALLRYSCYLIAFFAADISGDQIFLSIKAGIFPTLDAFLAICAFVFIGILTLMNHRRYRAS